MRRVLFVCGRNRRRSPTAEVLFRDHPGVEVQSAGLNADADNPISLEAVAWADVICVMEENQRRKLAQMFGSALKAVRVVSLDIADRYAFMDEELQRLLRERVGRVLG